MTPEEQADLNKLQFALYNYLRNKPDEEIVATLMHVSNTPLYNHNRMRGHERTYITRKISVASSDLHGPTLAKRNYDELHNSRRDSPSATPAHIWAEVLHAACVHAVNNTFNDVLTRAKAMTSRWRLAHNSRYYKVYAEVLGRQNTLISGLETTGFNRNALLHMTAMHRTKERLAAENLISPNDSSAFGLA